MKRNKEYKKISSANDGKNNHNYKKSNKKQLSCPPKKQNQEENLENDKEEAKITIYSTKENVYNYLKQISLDNNNKDIEIEKIKNDEIDGEAFIILMKNDVSKKLIKTYKIKNITQKEILKDLETDYFRENEDIKNDELYKEIFIKDFETLCGSLNDKINELKFGQWLKYIKYLIIKIKPNKDNKIELKNYFNKILSSQNYLDDIVNGFDDLLVSNFNDFIQKCEDWDLGDNDSFILKLIIEYAKINKNSNVNNAYDNPNINDNPNTNDNPNINDNPNNNYNPNINDNQNADNNSKDNIKPGKMKENNSENIEAAPNYFGTSINTPVEEQCQDSKYSFYCVVENFEYETSQGDIAYGMKNPIEEFKRICKDFRIKYENECEYIDFNEANQTLLSSNMIWGSKEGICSFLESKHCKNDFLKFMKENDNENKAGIYLCIDIIYNIGYLVIWEGKLSYQYTKISETNNNMLLTLLRYGFYISSNSILCLTKKEIDEIDKNGYEIFQKQRERNYNPELNEIDFDENEEKFFKIKEKKNLSEGIDDINQKNFYRAIINNNIILVFEEKLINISKEIKNKDLFEFIVNEEKLDFFFEEDFEVDEPEIFYLIIKQNPYYKKNNDKKKCFTNIQLNDSYEEKINLFIYDLFKRLSDEIFIEKKCMYCNKSINESLMELYYKIDNNIAKFFHESCYKNKENTNFNFSLFDDNEKYKLYEKHKDNILNSISDIEKEIIKEFFSNFESKSYLISENKKNLDYNIYLQEIGKLKENLLNNNIIKNRLMDEEIEFYNNIKNDEKCIKSWKENWKKRINNYYLDNFEKIDKWLVMKNYDNANKKFNYEYKDKNYRQNIVNLYKFLTYKDSDDLKLVNKDIPGIIINEKIDNYFSIEYKDIGLIIYKEGNKNKIYLNERDSITFEGMYDFEPISQTLIIYKNEGNQRKIGIYYNKNKDDTEKKNLIFRYYKDLDISSLNNEVIKKIMLIPSFEGHENQKVLLFTENEIKLFALDGTIESNQKTINLKENFVYKNFEELQFIVSLGFLLILSFNKNSNVWKGKIFSLIPMDISYFKEIENINIEFKANKNTIFSFSEIKDKKYLYGLVVENNKLKINYWEIDSQLSGLFRNRITSGENNEDIEQIIPLGNCILNFFYHCFDKYPLLGAIEYNFIKYEKKKKLLILSIFAENNYYYIIPELKHYLNVLKNFCEKKKKIDFNEVFDFRITDLYVNMIEKDISLGQLLIRCLEIVPIQVAKIMGYNFTIMSNGKYIDEISQIESEKKRYFGLSQKIKMEEDAKSIHFCIKESIFNYELPVVVICCFGTQSVGKSTFLNEITGALFDVSGMRCTEGIWMTVKLFIHSSKMCIKNCNKKCSFCKNKECYLLMGHENKNKNIKCICEDCMCGKDCQMKGKNNNSKCCDSKCCLKKGHEDLLKCVFENCECKCRCSCKCKELKHHKHICNKCKNKNKNECFCSCDCNHFCKNPILMHDFICIGLDFEGIGTFERTNEQDIQMALIGAAMGNIVFFRTHNTYDEFTDNTLEKLSLGSNKISAAADDKDKNDIDEFFGGSLLFSPRDANESHLVDLNKEFKDKVIPSLKKWNMGTKRVNKKYNIFGLFSSYGFAPTPPYLDEEFYKALRNKLIFEIVENCFKFRRHPIYETGKHFCSNFKMFLTLVSMRNYEFLSDFREKQIKNYLKDYQNKAYEVMGEYDISEEFGRVNYLAKLNNLRIYYNKEYLKNLEIDFNRNQKFEPSDTLLIDNIYNSQNIEGNYNIEEYGIKIKVEVKNKKDNCFSISVENLKDFGLILLIPETIKDINSQDLCHDLFLLWNDICKKLNFSEKDTLEKFELFISELIKRRIQNVNKWVQEITNNRNISINLQDHNIILGQNWKICKIKCEFCFLTCYKLSGHRDKHECPFDHKCKEKCQICSISKCNDNNCKEKNCTKENYHPGEHTCKHFHKCLNNCEYYNICKKVCVLEYGNHGENHRCDLAIHYCNGICELKDKARDCGETCNLPYPHPNGQVKHDCLKQHMCKENCVYKGKEGCNNICNKQYNHDPNEGHNCNKTHYCKEVCDLKDKARNCGRTCKLQYPHPEGKVKHDCLEQHMCKENCVYKGKKGCYNICDKKYDHYPKEEHNCNQTHYCIDDCQFKNKAKYCDGTCKLQYPHPKGRKEHNCLKQHMCKEDCDLKNDSLPNTCNGHCSKPYHTDGNHICDKTKDDHKCNKTCQINENCNKPCSLPAGHTTKCLCGQCTCPLDCEYKVLNSRNCQKKCSKTGGHKGEHKCQQSDHYCGQPCKYKGCSSSGCDGYCKYKVEKNVQHSDHICKNEMNMHKCNRACDLSSISGCNNLCDSSITSTNGHTGLHVCNAQNHSCRFNCILKDSSSNCLISCKEFVNNNSSIQDKERFKKHTNHICTLPISAHICNGTCTYDSQIGIKCRNSCIKQANHTDRCKCSGEHVCEELCKYYNDNISNKCQGCNKKCSLRLGHSGNEHLCGAEHRCKGICYLNEAKGCKTTCNYIYPHTQNHKCEVSRENHMCKKPCIYSSFRNCNKECKYYYDHSGVDCICKNQHYCNNICSYPGCGRYCCLPPNHPDEKCICDEKPQFHICNKICPLRNIAGGCGVNCKLDFRHKGECKCFVDENDPHTCLEKCELNKYEIDNNSNCLCGHVYNHREKNLHCYKCNGNCKMFQRGHLCGRKHKCKNDCNRDGFCFIEPFDQMPVKISSESGTQIEIKIAKIIKPDRYPCTIRVPENEFEHTNNEVHRCNTIDHLCGFKCKQCNNYCKKKKNHAEQHDCIHTNIVNSTFSITDNKSVQIKIKNEYVKIKDNEVAKIYNCVDYCIDQGQGHIHIVKKSEIPDINDPKVRYYKNDFYECKCSYFWEKILKFKHPLPHRNEIFDLCGCICPCDKDKSDIHNYCKFELWHGKDIPEDEKGEWLSPEGHKFKCDHPSGVYTIFLIDRSGSMGRDSIKPTNPDISSSSGHNNMLGASIEAVLKYCKKRLQINRREKCALIGYDDNADIIFNDYYISEEKDIKAKCLSYLKPQGCTEFINAFKKAKEILTVIKERREYIPVIILLTDGIDFHPKETIEYIKDVLMVDEQNEKYGCKIFCIYFQNGFEEEARDTLKKIAELGKTNEIFDSNSLPSLCDNFNDISDVIQKTIKLELKTCY